jgi:hypothetical protein
MATIVIDGVTQPGNTSEGEYPKFIVDSATGYFTIQFAAPAGTAGTWSGGQPRFTALEGDDAHINQWRFLPALSGYTPPANLPPAPPA